MKGRRMALSSHRKAMSTRSATSQNPNWRPKPMNAPAELSAIRHMASPFTHVKRSRGDGQGRDQDIPRGEEQRDVEIKAEDRENDPGEQDLSERIGFAHQQRLDRDRLVHEPRQHDGADDHDVARDDENDEPGRQMPLKSERHIDRNQEQLVGERIKVAAKLGMKLVSAGEEPVHPIAHAGDDENQECEQEVIRYDEPDRQRHEQDAPDGDEIGKVHWEIENRLLRTIYIGCSTHVPLIWTSFMPLP